MRMLRACNSRDAQLPGPAADTELDGSLGSPLFAATASHRAATESRPLPQDPSRSGPTPGMVDSTSTDRGHVLPTRRSRGSSRYRVAIDTGVALVLGGEPRLRSRLRQLLVASGAYALSLLAQWNVVSEALADGTAAR